MCHAINLLDGKRKERYGGFACRLYHANKKMKKILNIGIIGAGRIGKLHANNIIKRIPNAKACAISDVVPGVAEEFAKEAGIEKYGTDYKEILNDEAIDAVLICSSTNTHATISIEAAQAGKDIFCEKPIDYDLEMIQNVMEAVNEAGVKYQVGFNRRFDRNFKKIKEEIQQGRIGEVELIKITSRDPQPPPLDYIKVSGGILLDMTIHDFDMIRYISQSEVEEISVFGSCLVDPDICKANDVDTCIINMKLENGVLATIDNSRRAVYGYDQRMEVFGSKGQLSAGNETGSKVVFAGEGGVVSEKPLYFFLERYNEAFIEEMVQFVEACLYNKEIIAGAQDGLNSVLVGLAATKSLREGGAPVKVETRY